ncbi:glycosyltransferase [Lacticaseibacillus daqingensis]|uniref:glycosyltransferase n=1 Tax=Lacticaseibacillus daqingensis TaxID=2486014 RepID=UPI0013DE3325|nr:glycosyltransferase [Lacticaseibacillus daqingensis]
MKLTYAVVFYNHSNDMVQHLYQNLTSTVPSGYEYTLYLVNNSPANRELSECLKKIQKQDRHVVAINAAENRGFGAGNNLAIAQIESDYHLIVNPDIEIPDANQIRLMITYMEANKVVLLNPKIQDTSGQIQKLVKKNPTILDLGLRFLGSRVMAKRQANFVYDGMYDCAHEVQVISGSFMVCNTGVLKKVGGFDERYFLYMEDTDLCRKFMSYGSIYYYPDAYVIHEWQRQNRKSLKGIRQMLVSMVKYFNKWGWRFW